MAEYYMFHKPKGCISARTDPRHKTVMDYFPEHKREVLFHVGRLDMDTEGLLIVTDDGLLCHRLMMPSHKVSKTYFFWVMGELSEQNCRILEGGVRISRTDDSLTSEAKIDIISKSTLASIRSLLDERMYKLSMYKPDIPITSGTITITEGKKHQVKRMLMNVGCRVVYLKRLSIGRLSLDPDLPLGEFRPLTEYELDLLNS